MIWVFALAAGFWLLGSVMQVPKPKRWVMIGVLYAVVVLAHLILPDTAQFRKATGEWVGPWLILGGLFVLVMLYRRFLSQLRQRATPSKSPEPATMQDAELERYARHILLREIGGVGQKRLKEAKVLVIGAGGLGSPALLYLAGAGVGTIGVIDHDEVEASNLQRQIIHRDSTLGMPKVHSAEQAMKALTPFVSVRPYNRKLTTEITEELFAKYDLILDGTDSLATRRMANAAAVKLGKPYLCAAITQWEGQISLYHPASGGPCYACIFPDDPADGLAQTCAEAGVVGPLPGVLGSMMALEAIKWLTGAGEPLRGKMLIYDALYSETRLISVKAQADCPICANATKQGL